MKILFWIWVWIKPMRPAACLSAFFGTLASWGIAYHTINGLSIWTSFGCFWTAVCTMVVNNWCDRYHDLMKDPPEDFAWKNARIYFWYMLGCLALECLIILHLFGLNQFIGALVVFQVILGLSYSIARKVTCLSAIIVAVTSALCTVTPAMVGKPNHAMWCFLVGTMSIIFAREQYKDIQDFEADHATGYKKTIASTKGPNVAKTIARLSLVFGSLLFLTMPLTVLPKPAALSGIICLSALSLSAYVVANSFKEAKKLLDSGFASFILMLNWSYWLLMIMEPARRIALDPISCNIILGICLILAYTKPDIITRFVKNGLDNGKEHLPSITQGRLLWPMMYLLFWLTMFAARVIATQELTLTHISDPLSTATILTAVLISIVIFRPPHIRVENRSYGYTVIERMSIGIVIGFFFTVYDLLGLPLTVTGFAIPLLSIVQPELEPLCLLLRSRGGLLGMFASVAIIKGFIFTLVHIAPVYISIVAIYYIWRRLQGIPVFVPRSLLGDLMLRLGFTPEGATT